MKMSNSTDNGFELTIGEIETLLIICGYLGGLWTAGRAFEVFGLPSYLGQILTGVLLGPGIWDVVPFTVGFEDEGRTIWSVMGSIGALLFLFESGLSVNLQQMRLVMGRSVLIALVGALGPISLSYLLFYGILSKDLFPSTMSASFSLSPTSIGLTTRLLLETRQFRTVAGQSILTASFIDDIIGLSLFLMLITIASGELNPATLPLLLVYVSLLVVFGLVCAIVVFPYVYKLLLKVRERPKKNIQVRDELLLGLMVASLFLFGYVGSLIGSELIGTFVAGVSFSTVSRARFVWREQTTNISQWLMRLFFGATVAFSIPIDALLDVTAFWNGLLVALLPIFCGKLLCSLLAPHKASRWVIGFAMVTRGEFSFIIAETAQRLRYSDSDLPGGEPMMTEDVYSSIIWGIVLSMFVLPYVFKRVAKQGIKDSGASKLKIEFVGKHHTNILYELQEILRINELEVLAATVNSDGDIDDDSFIVHLRGGRILSNQRIERLKADLNAALQWSSSDDRITVTPIEPDLTPPTAAVVVDAEEKSPAVEATMNADVAAGPVRDLMKLDSLKSLKEQVRGNVSKTWLEITFNQTNEGTDPREVADQLRNIMTENAFMNQQVIYDQGRSRVYLLEDGEINAEVDIASRLEILQLVHDFLMKPNTAKTWNISTNFDVEEESPTQSL